MLNTELVFAVVLVGAMLTAAVTFALAQGPALQRATTLPDAERRYERRRAYRRLLGCALLALMALLIVAQYGLWEWRVKHIADPVPDSERPYVRLWLWMWVVLLVSLVIVLAMTAWDAFLARSRALRERARHADERRAMIARQVERLREG